MISQVLIQNLIAFYCSTFLRFYTEKNIVYEKINTCALLFILFYIFSSPTMYISICSAIYKITSALNYIIDKYRNNGDRNTYFKKI